MELDHIFILTHTPDAAAARLAALGLTEGPPNVHPGQGTACRRFFFLNAYIELLYVIDEAEVKSKSTRPTHLWERWSGVAHSPETVCPFGLAFRPHSSGLDAQQAQHEYPFPVLEYRPPYLPQSACILLADNAHILTEPMIFVLPFAKRPDSHLSRPPLEHAAGFREITRLKLSGQFRSPSHPPSRALAWLDKRLCKASDGDRYGIEVNFDDEKRGLAADVRPDLPMTICW